MRLEIVRDCSADKRMEKTFFFCENNNENKGVWSSVIGSRRGRALIRLRRRRVGEKELSTRPVQLSLLGID